MSEVGLEVHYKLGHTRGERWESLDIFCPECGEKHVWREMSAGDYYVGPSYLCAACGGGGQILFGPAAVLAVDNYDNQRLAAIRAAPRTEVDGGR